MHAVVKLIELHAKEQRYKPEKTDWGSRYAFVGGGGVGGGGGATIR